MSRRLPIFTAHSVKSVGHDEKDCRAYDLMHERSRDTYRIQGEAEK
jgi:hypothetical protein